MIFYSYVNVYEKLAIQKTSRNQFQGPKETGYHECSEKLAMFQPCFGFSLKSHDTDNPPTATRYFQASEIEALDPKEDWVAGPRWSVSSDFDGDGD